MRKTILAAGAGILLGWAGCASSPTVSDYLTPEQAVLQAAEAAPAGVPGTFVLVVAGASAADGDDYLDSQKDYRDQRNLAVDVTPHAAAQLKQQYGKEPLAFFVGKRIAVAGTAYRAKIIIRDNGKPTGLYYYQTHLRVVEAAQIRLLP